MKKNIILILLFLCNASLYAQLQVRDKPNPPRLVNDYAGIMKPETVDSLERRLVEYHDSTSNEICIVTEKNLGDFDIFTYSQELFVKWGIGSKKNDNGVLLLVALDEKKVRIHVGKGLEGVLPDGTCGNIIRVAITPPFKSGDYNQGIVDGVNAIIGYIGGEYKDRPQLNPQFSWDSVIIPIIIFVLFIGLAVISAIRTERKIRRTMLMYGITYLAARKLLGLDRPSSPGGGGWGGFTNWGGGGSSGSGGGFGGFGGGDSGGGGAQGGW